MTHRRPVAIMVALLALSAGTVVGPAAAQDGSSAPGTSLSNGGRTVSDGTRSLSISQAEALDPGGQTVSVSGAGFPTDKGIYVAFCVIPPTNLPPTPCGGGRGDQGTSTDTSLWISSNPPAYAAGVPTPYDAGGSFSGTLALAPAIADGLDCREVRCAVVTRADHTRSSDRSLDLFVPVTFAAATPGSTTPTTAPPPAPTVPTTVPVLDPAQVAPAASVSGDALTVFGGGRSLVASKVVDLDPGGAEVSVHGSGFDVGQGIYVALCALPDPDPTLAAGASPEPGPCTAGSEGAATWVSSNPPDYGEDLAVPYEQGGAFHTKLELRAVIDATHDCRTVGCAIVTRNDDTHAADRTQDLYLPVAFATTGAARVDDGAARAADATARARDAGQGGRGSARLLAGAGAGVVALGAGAALLARRRRPSRPETP